nr:MAG TPA: hypothetical protein [Caudoviricetes sp.]
MLRGTLRLQLGQYSSSPESCCPHSGQVMIAMIVPLFFLLPPALSPGGFHILRLDIQTHVRYNTYTQSNKRAASNKFVQIIIFMILFCWSYNFLCNLHNSALLTLCKTEKCWKLPFVPPNRDRACDIIQI